MRLKIAPVLLLKSYRRLALLYAYSIWFLSRVYVIPSKRYEACKTVGIELSEDNLSSGRINDF